MRLFSAKNLKRFKKIFEIALPSGMSSFLDIFNISIALLFIGKLSTSHIVAFGMGMNFIMLFYTITAIFFTGTNATIARLYAQHTQRKTALFTLLICSLLCSIPLFFIALFTQIPYLTWMGADEQSSKLASEFLNILAFALPPLLLKTTLTSAFSAISKANIPFYVKIFCTLFNILTNYILIFGLFSFPRLELFGAGIANLLSISLEALLLVLLTKKYFSMNFKLDFSYFKLALKIGIPTGVERAFTLFSLVVISKFLINYGGEILAGFQIGGRIEAFAFMPGFGFMIASMTLMGQNIKKIKIGKAYVYLTLYLSIIFMGILGILMCIFGTSASLIFSSNAQVIQYSYAYLVAVGISQIPLITIFVLDGALRGLGASKISLIINACSIWGLRIIPMYFCTLFHFCVYYIFAIICIETFIRAGIFWWIFDQEKFSKSIVKI
ncbi:MATE family efflux transporter [Helicobacter cholecystus]|uniref:Multidrug-efflux transporter n=1 Tax=Helicobacter cholecystus TaxID=45498 RepID=A0A3D8IX15_9HELI|nr:MATE family efflux transporter [Helicobacter cholecystus]RDU69520.1 MATE family efflux transporter [Helicobacter cholecystus]VEJ24074.1 sodium-driven multidrug efflux pump protein [Helicobacter cholecystus]